MSASVCVCISNLSGEETAEKLTSSSEAGACGQELASTTNAVFLRVLVRSFFRLLAAWSSRDAILSAEEGSERFRLFALLTLRIPLLYCDVAFGGIWQTGISSSVVSPS